MVFYESLDKNISKKCKN